MKIIKARYEILTPITGEGAAQNRLMPATP